MPSKDDILQESYKDKSNSIQKITIIFLGVAFFFFFMVLIPYYSLRLDNHRILQMDNILAQARDNISSVNQSLMQQQAKNASMIYDSIFLSKEIPKQPYKDIRKQYFDTIYNISKYPIQINVSKLNETLQRITYKECMGKVGSPSWISCNLKHRDKALKEKISLGNLTAFAPLNTTIITRLNNSITLQNELINESKNFQLNTSNFVLVRDALKRLYDPKNLSVPLNNTKYLEDIIHHVATKNFINLTISKVLAPLDTVASQINNRTGDFEKRFNNFEAPVVGKIPVGFNEMVAIFPVSLAIVFVYLAGTLRDVILLKRLSQLSNATVWMDPDRPEKLPAKILHSALAWTVLALPLVLFISSLYLIYQIWNYTPARADKFPVFIGAPDFNMSFYGGLYFFSAISFVLSYLVIAYTTARPCLSNGGRNR